MSFAPGTVLLDTALPSRENASSYLFTDPLEVLVAHSPEDVRTVLHALDEATRRGRWVAGFLAYEAGRAFEPLVPLRHDPGLLAWFGVYAGPSRLNATAVEGLLRTPSGTPVVSHPRFEPGRDVYLAAVDRVRAHIREGDVYQVNYTGRLVFDFGGDPMAWYGELRRAQPVPYGAVLHTGERWVLSLSPELFFRREGERVVTRPMKGTAPRGRSAPEDLDHERHLRADEKSRAENLMIVDLLRNDLSRCCLPGSVHVPALFETERHPTVIQMTSTVAGTLQPGTPTGRILEVLFPCGSVTGAPKIRAMQLIDALEGSPRGVYCGAIGFAAPDDRAVFSVAIRTIELRAERGVMGSGSGVVWDSVPAAERDEARLKTQFLLCTLAERPVLIETMRWEDGIALVDRHRTRMEASAGVLGYDFDARGWEEALDDATAGLPSGLPHRIRLTLDTEGRFGATATAAEPREERALRLKVASEPVDSKDPWLYHKTSARERYERAYRQAVAEGFDEVVFRNERGELTEGSRTNLFLLRAGRYLTPPVGCGLLPGVYRAKCLETMADAVEQVLTLDELKSAEAVFVCNAVWGWREAVVPASVWPDIVNC